MIDTERDYTPQIDFPLLCGLCENRVAFRPSLPHSYGRVRTKFLYRSNEHAKDFNTAIDLFSHHRVVAATPSLTLPDDIMYGMRMCTCILYSTLSFGVR